jgi:hypothetical protein
LLEIFKIGSSSIVPLYSYNADLVLILPEHRINVRPKYIFTILLLLLVVLVWPGCHIGRHKKKWSALIKISGQARTASERGGL